MASYLTSYITSYMFRSPDQDMVSTKSAPYEPSVEDVLAVKAFLVEHTELLVERNSLSDKLPRELIDQIIDQAEYWPHRTTETPKAVTARGGGLAENVFVLRSDPIGFSDNPFDARTTLDYQYATKQPQLIDPVELPPSDATQALFDHWTAGSEATLKHPVRKIVFTIKSHDQGWGGTAADRGTYRGSWTWFEAGLERIVASTQPTDTACMQAQGQEKEKVNCTLETVVPRTVLATPAPSPRHRLRGHPRHENRIPEARTAPAELQPAFEFVLHPAKNHIQRNKTAIRDMQTHVVTWRYDDSIVALDEVGALETQAKEGQPATENVDDTSHSVLHESAHAASPEAEDEDFLEIQGRGRESGDGSFVRELKVGDVITVWAKARFSGWANSVESVKMDVYWVV